jgi:hypothetical protein
MVCGSKKLNNTNRVLTNLPGLLTDKQGIGANVELIGNASITK